MKNFLIQKLCSWIKIPKNQRKERPKILVVSTTALGDTLWGTPALESLRKSFPDAYIACMTSKIGYEVLKTNPWIDALYLVSRFSFFTLFLLWKKLFAEKFDTILILHASQRIVFPFCFSLAPSQMLGTFGINKGLDALFTKTLAPSQEHEIVRRLRLVEASGGKIHSEKLFFSPDPKEKILLPPGQWIALHPGSKDGFKRWKKEHFISLGQMLRKEGFDILITGTKNEKALTQEIASHIEGAVTLPDHLSLHQFAHILTQASLLISNDTGPVHLACAVNVPVLAFYGPTNPLLCGPHKAENAHVIAHKPTCTPCLKRACKTPFCLLQTGPEEVFNYIRNQGILCRSISTVI